MVVTMMTLVKHCFKGRIGIDVRWNVGQVYDVFECGIRYSACFPSVRNRYVARGNCTLVCVCTTPVKREGVGGRCEDPGSAVVVWRRHHGIDREPGETR